MTANSLLQVRVARKQVQALDIVSLDLVAVDGSALPPFTPGAHVDVHLPGGLVRQYSLCNDPAGASCYRIGVLRTAPSRGGSEAVHALTEGQVLSISAPRNQFPLAAGAQQHVLVAGGIGLTPLLCMAEQLAREGKAFTLHYAVRDAERVAFRDRLESAALAPHVQLHLSSDPAVQQQALARVLASPATGSHLYVCGPGGFMDAVLATARTAGWAADCLHSESFTPVVEVRDTDGDFEIEIASTGQVILVERGQTALAALSINGVQVLSSCEQGICGTCLTGVKAGVPDHRDQYLTEEEQAANDQFLPCCSRAKSARLVVDL
jgi:vanillate O-demethylase ferredoxin subunit